MGMTNRQIEKVHETLAVSYAGMAEDALQVLDTYGIPDTTNLPDAADAAIGDLVVIQGTGRDRVARVWATTRGKVSAYYVTPGAVDEARRYRADATPNVMSGTQDRATAHLYLPRAEAPAVPTA